MIRHVSFQPKVRFGGEQKDVRQMTEKEFNEHVAKLETQDRVRQGGGDPRYQQVSEVTRKHIEYLEKLRSGRDPRY